MCIGQAPDSRHRHESKTGLDNGSESLTFSRKVTRKHRRKVLALNPLGTEGS
jgi:hypothetical protein